jgi:uncharacterized protein YbbK (DUF523 family)
VNGRVHSSPSKSVRETPGRPRIGVSACLIGREVRYAGGHKWNAAVVEEIGPVVEWVPVCPEVEIGLGVPREAIELFGPAAAPELIGTVSGRRLTDTMNAWAARRVLELEALRLAGYIFKKNSPSCGVAGVPRYESRGGDVPREPARDGVGLFARAIREGLPDLPVEEEDRLADPELRQRFLVRVFDYWLRVR